MTAIASESLRPGVWNAPIIMMAEKLADVIKELGVDEKQLLVEMKRAGMGEEDGRTEVGAGKDLRGREWLGAAPGDDQGQVLQKKGGGDGGDQQGDARGPAQGPICAPLQEHPHEAGEADQGPFRLLLDVQEMMQRDSGIARSDDLLTDARDRLREIGRRAAALRVAGNREFNPGWHAALDLRNVVTVAEAVVLAGRERRESRGAHSRVDYPDKDPEWGGVNLVLHKSADGEMEIRREPIPEMPGELTQIIEEQG